MLVVIAIIATLASMLIPTIGIALERGRAAACRSNLKQIGAALSMYEDDNEGYLPNQQATGGNPPYYTERLKRYLSHAWVWGCPSLTKWTMPNEAWKTARKGAYLLTDADGWGRGWPSYGAAAHHVIVPEDNGRKKISEIASPSRVYAFGEMILLAWGNYPEYFIYCPIEGAGEQVSYEIHGTGNNVLFVDGHVNFILHSRMLETPVEGDDPWNHFGL